MISDVLADAVREIDGYLEDDAFAYGRELRGCVIAVRDQMDALRGELDRPPVEAT